MAGPNELGRLMLMVMDRDGYGDNVMELSRHTSAVSYQTLYAWITGTPERNRKRPPAESVLRQLAADLALPEPTVFAAAGRAHRDAQALDSQAMQYVGVIRSVPEDKRQTVLLATSLIGKLDEKDMQIVMRLARDLEARQQG